MLCNMKTLERKDAEGKTQDHESFQPTDALSQAGWFQKHLGSGALG
jgi:hypothetical protein